MRTSAFVLAVILATVPASAFVEAGSPNQPARRSTPQEYRDRLEALQGVVEECSRVINGQNCSPSRVGPDENVAIQGGTRHVSYEWLRSALDSAASLNAKNSQKTKNEAARLLEESQDRLRQEQTLVQGRTAGSGGDLADRHDMDMHQRMLAGILAGHEFEHVTQQGFFARIANRILQWLDRRLSGVVGNSRRARWIARLFMGAVVLGACTALVWWFVRQSKQQRLDFLSTERLRPNDASARDWQRWQDEALLFSRAGRWREAVHGLYWAAIARLESRGIWSIDSTRTPREYLAILEPGHASHADLYALTKTFERIWYGQNPASQREYEIALAHFERLASQ